MVWDFEASGESFRQKDFGNHMNFESTGQMWAVSKIGLVAPDSGFVTRSPEREGCS
jgi:hypothetical protein